MECALESTDLRTDWRPGIAEGCRFSPKDCQTVTYPAATFGFGLGAFGHGFDDAQWRFGGIPCGGWFGGVSATDGTNVPDFIVSSGKLVPGMNVLYGLRCEADSRTSCDLKPLPPTGPFRSPS